MSGGRYAGLEVLGKYWCSTCGESHYKQPASEEYIMKTGWVMVEGQYINIGFCNGTHTDKSKPVFLARRNASTSEESKVLEDIK